MKRIISVIIALVMMLSLACTVFAAEEVFVGSISEKGAPEVVSAILVKDGETLATLTEECILVTSVAEAELSELIPADAKAALLDVYAKLCDGTMQLPAEKLEATEMVVRELVDISIICEEHAAMLAEEGVSLQVVFKLGAAENDNIQVMTYKNDEWNPIVSTVNNGDGTVTCTFDHLCPAAFALVTQAKPGDAFRTELVFFAALMCVSAAALVVVVSRRKSFRA